MALGKIICKAVKIRQNKCIMMDGKNYYGVDDLSLKKEPQLSNNFYVKGNSTHETQFNGCFGLF